MNISSDPSRGCFDRFRSRLPSWNLPNPFYKVKEAFTSLSNVFRSKPEKMNEERQIIQISKTRVSNKYLAVGVTALILGAGYAFLAYRKIASDLIVPNDDGVLFTRNSFKISSVIPPINTLIEEFSYIGDNHVSSDVFGPSFCSSMVTGSKLPEGVEVISQPMRVLGSVPTLSIGASSANTLVVNDKYAFVSYGSTVQIIDITQERSPTVLTSMGIGGTGIFLKDHFLYGVKAGIPYTFTKSDISNIYNSKTLATLKYTDVCCIAPSMLVSKDICYITGNKFRVIDTSWGNPPNITDTQPISSINPGGGIAAIDDTHIVIGANTPFPSAQFLDVSNKFRTKVIKVVPLPFQPETLVVNGTDCFAVGGGVFSVIDFSNITNAHVVGGLSGTGKKMAWDNKLFYVVNTLSVDVIDAVTNKTAPVVVNTLFTGASFQYSSIQVKNGYIYVTDNDAFRIATRGNTFNFVGTPSGGAKGNYSSLITARTPQGKTANATFGLTVQPAIRVRENIPVQRAVVGSDFNYNCEGIFQSVNGNVLTYKGSTSNWLQVDSNGLVWGNPSDLDAGKQVITITAKDTPGASALAQLEIQVFRGIEVSKTIGNKFYINDKPFSFTIEENTFINRDQDGPLTLSAITSNGLPFPDYLHFDPITRTFSGMPKVGDLGTTQIIVTATSPSGIKQQTSFQITIVSVTVPSVNSRISNQLVTVDNFFKFLIPPDTMVCPYGSPILYSVNLSGGDNWLSFVNDTLSGTPGSGDQSVLSNKIIYVLLTGRSDYGINTLNFNVEISGDSTFIRVFKVLGPIGTIIGLSSLIYRQRAWFMKRCRCRKHIRTTETARIGQIYQHEIKEPLKDIREIRTSAGGNRIPGITVPHGFIHDQHTNVIRSDNVPASQKLKKFKIVISGTRLVEHIEVIIVGDDEKDALIPNDPQLQSNWEKVALCFAKCKTTICKKRRQQQDPNIEMG